MRTLLQNAAIVITKCVSYYKMRRCYKINAAQHTLSVSGRTELQPKAKITDKHSYSSLQLVFA